MASRLFAPASSERVDNSGSLREIGPQTDESADNEPTKRRSSSLVGDLAASILGADVLAARKAPPPPFPDAEDASDGTRYFFAGGGRNAKISSHGTLSPALAAKGVPPQQWAAFREDLKKLPSLKRSMWRPLCRSSARKQAWLDAVEKLGDKYIAKRPGGRPRRRGERGRRRGTCRSRA